MDGNQRVAKKPRHEQLNIWEANYTRKALVNGVFQWDCNHCYHFYSDPPAIDRMNAHLLTNHFEKLKEPCNNAVRKKVLAECRTYMTGKLFGEVTSIRNKVSLTVEFWENYQGLNFMLTRLHNIDQSFNKWERILDISRLTLHADPQNTLTRGSDIHDCIMYVAKKFNIENRIVMCTYQQNKFGMLLSNYLDDLKRKNLPLQFGFMKCLGTFLEETIQDFLISQGDILKKTHLVFDILTNPKHTISSDFKTLVNERFNETVGFSKSWKPTYIMLNLLSKNNQEIDDMLSKYEIGSGRNDFRYEKGIVLEKEERENLKHMVDFLDKVYEATTAIEETNSTCFGVWLLILKGLADYTTRFLAEKQDLPNDFANTVTNMGDKLNTLISSVAQDQMFYHCAMVDVSARQILIDKVFRGNYNTGEAKTYLERNHPELFAGNPNELERYMDDVTFKSDIDTIATWWEVQKGVYPSVARLAQDLLSVEGSCRDPRTIFTSLKEVKEIEYRNLEGDEAEMRCDLLLKSG